MTTEQSDGGLLTDDEIRALPEWAENGDEEPGCTCLGCMDALALCVAVARAQLTKANATAAEYRCRFCGAPNSATAAAPKPRRMRFAADEPHWWHDEHDDCKVTGCVPVEPEASG